MHTRDFHGNLGGVVDILNALCLSSIEETRSYTTRQLPHTVPDGLLFHSVVLVFRTADDEFCSFRLPTASMTAEYLDADGLVVATNPDIVALTSYLVGSVITDERGVTLSSFVGGYFAFDDALFQ